VLSGQRQIVFFLAMAHLLRRYSVRGIQRGLLLPQLPRRRHDIRLFAQIQAGALLERYPDEGAKVSRWPIRIEPSISGLQLQPKPARKRAC